MRSLIPALVLLAGCGATSPKAVLTDYLEAERAGRYEAAHALLTEADREARPVARYAAEHLSAGPIWLAVARRTRFELGDPKGPDDTGLVTVPVQATHLDMKAVEAGLDGLAQEALDRAPDKSAALMEHVQTQLDAKPFPEVTEALTYALRDDDGAWRVWLGLARQDAAVALVKQARAAEASADAAAARAAWTQVTELPEDPSGVVAMFQKQAQEALAALDVQAALPVVRFDGQGQPLDGTTTGDCLILVADGTIQVVRVEVLAPDAFGPRLTQATNQAALTETARGALAMAHPAVLADPEADAFFACPDGVAAKAVFSVE